MWYLSYHTMCLFPYFKGSTSGRAKQQFSIDVATVWVKQMWLSQKGKNASDFPATVKFKRKTQRFIAAPPTWPCSCHGRSQSTCSSTNLWSAHCSWSLIVARWRWLKDPKKNKRWSLEITFAEKSEKKELPYRPSPLRMYLNEECTFRKFPNPTWPTKYWLVVWNINLIFPYIGNNHPNWLSYFSEGWPNHQPEIYCSQSPVCSYRMLDAPS